MVSSAEITPEKRYILWTQALLASTITGWGRRGCAIEVFFKTAKHCFGLYRFGHQTRLGVSRSFVLCLSAYLFAHWTALDSKAGFLQDWGKAAHLALELLLPLMALLLLLARIQRLLLTQHIQ